MSFEGEATVSGVSLMPVAAAGATVIAAAGAAAAALGVAAAVAAFRGSCLVARGLVYTGQEARKAWHAHVAMERARALRELEAHAEERRARVMTAVAAARVSTGNRTTTATRTKPDLRIVVRATDAELTEFAAAEDRLLVTFDLPVWRELYGAYLARGAEEAIRNLAGQMRAHLLEKGPADARRIANVLRRRIDTEATAAELAAESSLRTQAAASDLEAEFETMQSDGLMARLLDGSAVAAARAELARARDAARLGDTTAARERMETAEKCVAELREAGFRRLAALQREYVTAKVSETLAAMGYGRPTAIESGSWTVLEGNNGVRPFTVAVTEDLRLVFDLGHEGFEGLAPCRAEVEQFLGKLRGGVELRDVDLAPTHPRAAQEQKALALLRRLQEMGADVEVEQDGQEVVLTAGVADETVCYRVTPEGEATRGSRGEGGRKNGGAKKTKARG